MEDLVGKVRQLETLYHAVLDAAIEEQDVEKAHAHLRSYHKVRQDIRLSLLPRSVAALPEITDKKIRAQLQKISTGNDLPEGFIRGLFQDSLDADHIMSLSEDLFFSWFDPYGYIEGLYDVGSVVLGIGLLPDFLEDLVNELRNCFVFQQYNATCALCRTVLEISVRDIFVRAGLDDPHSQNYLYVEQRVAHTSHRWFLDAEDPSLAQMIGMLCLLRPYRALKHQLRHIVDRGNDLIHGYIKVDRKEAEHMLRATMQAIHDLYEVEN
ncbi:MAG: hypothetical protein R2834_10255 [Rhodothermales bacterium]